MIKISAPDDFKAIGAIVAQTPHSEIMAKAWLAANDVAGRHGSGRMVLLFIAVVGKPVDATGTVDVDVPTLAAHCGLPVDAAVQALADLSAAGLLAVKGAGRRRRATFAFVVRQPIGGRRQRTPSRPPPSVTTSCTQH